MVRIEERKRWREDESETIRIACEEGGMNETGTKERGKYRFVCRRRVKKTTEEKIYTEKEYISSKCKSEECIETRRK